MPNVNNTVSSSPVVPSTRRVPSRSRWVALALSVALGGVAVTLPACNTTEGAGKDVQAVGRGIENAADGAKP